MNISGIEIGSGQPCRFVAELSNNWRTGPNETDRQMRDRMGRLIDAAKAAGADFTKLQAYTADELVALRGDGSAPEPWGSQGWTMRSLYEYAATPFEWFPLIKAHCERVGMPWFSSVFGPESLALLESLDCPAYKLARLDNKARSLSTMVAKTRKPLIVSESEWDQAVTRRHVNLARLYCPVDYPQTAFAFERASEPQWGEFAPGTFDSFDGFSYHGTDPLPCIVAAALGAKLIEFHLQLCDEPSELEANVSLTQHQAREMIEQVRKIERMLA